MKSSASHLDREPIDLTQSTSLLQQYFEQLTLDKVLASGGKRAAKTIVVKSFDITLGKLPVFLPFKWGLGTLLGSLAKQKVMQMLSRQQLMREDDFVLLCEENNDAEQVGETITHDQPPEFLSTLDEDDFVVLGQENEDGRSVKKMSVQEQPPDLSSAIKIIVWHLKEDVESYVTHLTPEDLAAGTAGAIASVAATGAIILVSGPLGWVALPVELMLEGSSRSVMSFMARWCSRQYWGEKAKKPFFKNGRGENDAVQLALSEIEDFERDACFLPELQHSPVKLSLFSTVRLANQSVQLYEEYEPSGEEIQQRKISYRF